VKCDICNSTNIRTTKTCWNDRHTCLDCGAYKWSGSTSTFATKHTHALRSKVKPIFIDKKINKLGRDKAYRWLAKAMRIPRKKAHVGMFNDEQCLKLYERLMY
jgi:hypothetical protein